MAPQIIYMFAAICLVYGGIGAPPRKTAETQQKGSVSDKKDSRSATERQCLRQERQQKRDRKAAL